MRRNRIKKSLWLPLVFFIYTTAMAVYFLPNNHEMGTREKWATLIVSYLIVVLLWWMLKKKEQIQERRENQMNNINQNKE